MFKSKQLFLSELYTAEAKGDLKIFLSSSPLIDAPLVFFTGAHATQQHEKKSIKKYIPYSMRLFLA
jgi:hypothetical protein